MPIDYITKIDEHFLETEKFNNLVITSGKSELNLCHFNIRNLIISQLTAVSAANLRFEIIFHEISCSCKDCLKKYAIANISGLVDSGKGGCSLLTRTLRTRAKLDRHYNTKM
jgi:hypothetical protein